MQRFDIREARKVLRELDAYNDRKRREKQEESRVILFSMGLVLTMLIFYIAISLLGR